ncbi:hypothetical protein HDZ31DRAFT_63728 [Schizophyllum fasciatum]
MAKSPAQNTSGDSTGALAGTHNRPPESVSIPEDELQRAQSTLLGTGMALAQVQDMVQQLLNRASSFEELGNAGPVQESIQELEALMRKQEEEHQHAIREVELVLEDALEKSIPENLTTMVNERFDAVVDDIVAKETERYLEDLAGIRIQREVAGLRNTLREKQTQLHNCEARRENALLREQDEDVPLKKLRLADGTIHPSFPSTVRELRGMSADAIKKLMAAYRIDSAPPGPGGVMNINRVLQHFGVKGCLVTPL